MIENQSKYFHAWPMIDDCDKDFMNTYLKQQQSFIWCTFKFMDLISSNWTVKRFYWSC